MRRRKSHRACTFATAGEAIPFGSVLRPSTTVDRQVVQTTSEFDPAVVGVATEDVSSGDSVCMAVGGEFQVLVTGAVARGELLASSTVTGVAESVGASPVEVGAFSVAMNSDTTTTVKLVYARFIKSDPQ